MSVTFYRWRVTMRDDLRGFQRTYEVTASLAMHAVDLARSRAIDGGYQPDQLAVTRLERLREVR